MFKLMLFVILLGWLTLSPKTFFISLATIFCIVFLFTHPIISILGFLGLCFVVGWCVDIAKNNKENTKSNQTKEERRREEYRQYNQQQRNYNSTRYFQGCITKDQLKKKHRQLCMKLHPDRGGNINQFRNMQEEYEMLIKKFN